MRSVSSNRGHRAGQCAPEVPRTRIRARGDLQELRHGQPTTPFATQHLHHDRATASSSTRDLRPRPCASLITHRIPESRPGGSLIWRRYGGGVGNRCRWAERFAMSEQRPMWQQDRWALILIGAANGRTPQLRVSKSGPVAPDC